MPPRLGALAKRALPVAPDDQRGHLDDHLQDRAGADREAEAPSRAG